MPTMFINRSLGRILQKSKKSILLLGPRQTGKSTLIKTILQPDLIINLAHEPTYLDFTGNPRELENRLKAKIYPTVFMDEVQRLPSLLNTIQSILDDWKNPPRFYLTGSSARKLRRGQANLLPGRLHTYFLGTLCCQELNYEMNTTSALETGTLPGIYTDESYEDRIKTLKSYAGSYLKEEIQAEALTKNIEGFSRFLFVAALCSGQFLDMSQLASEAHIPRQTAMRYFEILEDTLIVNRCEAFSISDRKRLVKHPKYYFFDTGVLNALHSNFRASNDRKGMLFEHLFFNQLLASARNLDKEIRISTYRTDHGAEIDFIIELEGKVWACELKASTNVGSRDLRGLKYFTDNNQTPFNPVVVYLGEVEKEILNVPILPWQIFFKRLGF